MYTLRLYSYALAAHSSAYVFWVYVCSFSLLFCSSLVRLVYFLFGTVYFYFISFASLHKYTHIIHRGMSERKRLNYMRVYTYICIECTLHNAPYLRNCMWNNGGKQKSLLYDRAFHTRTAAANTFYCVYQNSFHENNRYWCIFPLLLLSHSARERGVSFLYTYFYTYTCMSGGL